MSNPPDDAVHSASGDEPAPPPRPDAAAPGNQVRFIATQEALVALCADLLAQDRIGLDVETTLIDRDLCLIQLSTASYNAVIDARAMTDLGPVADVLASPSGEH